MVYIVSSRIARVTLRHPVSKINKHTIRGQNQWLMLVILALRRLRQEDRLEFGDNRDFTVSPRPAWATESVPVLKTQTNRKYHWTQV